jgi:hypothetical protein
MVSVVTAAPERLHVIAHRVVVAARCLDGGWNSPLESSLVALSLARHSNAYVGDAQGLLDRVLRWWREGRTRRTSADIAALALIARTAVDLKRGNAEVVSAAAQIVEDLATRDQSLVPELHLALSAWALDPVIKDRDSSPWPALRVCAEGRAETTSHPLLNNYVTAVSQWTFSWPGMADSLGGNLTSNEELGSACVLLWLLTAVCEKISPLALEYVDGIQLIAQRRSELVERMAGQIDERTFYSEEFAQEEDFESECEVQPALSSFEAVLIDVALASRDEARPWMTFDEAEAYFAQRARAERDEAQTSANRMRYWLGATIGLLGLVAGFALWEPLRHSGVKSSIANPGSASVVFFSCAIMVGIFRGKRQDTPIWESLGIFLTTAALLAGALSINQAFKKPLVSDAGGVVVAALVAVGAGLLWAMIRMWRRK